MKTAEGSPFGIPFHTRPARFRAGPPVTSLMIDHYHRYKEDVQLLKNVRGNRISISSHGRGFSPRNMASRTRKVSTITIASWTNCSLMTIPAVCPLSSLGLPQTLPDNGGGWESRDTSKAFGDYAAYVAEHLDRVKHFFTINEFGLPYVDLSYKIGSPRSGPEIA